MGLVYPPRRESGQCGFPEGMQAVVQAVQLCALVLEEIIFIVRVRSGSCSQ